MNKITKEVIRKTEEILKQLGFKITRKAFEYWSLAVIIKIRQKDVTMEQIYSLIAKNIMSLQIVFQNEYGYLLMMLIINNSKSISI